MTLRPLVALASPGAQASEVRWVSLGWTITTEYRFDRADEADLVIVPAAGQDRGFGSPAVLDLLRRTVDRGAIVASICSGAFALGAAGLLDGRDCTTHWRYAEQLA